MDFVPPPHPMPKDLRIHWRDTLAQALIHRKMTPGAEAILTALVPYMKNPPPGEVVFGIYGRGPVYFTVNGKQIHHKDLLDTRFSSMNAANTTYHWLRRQRAITDGWLSEMTELPPGVKEALRLIEEKYMDPAFPCAELYEAYQLGRVAQIYEGYQNAAKT